MVGFTYDGTYIRSYFNGEFKARNPELIKHTKGKPGYPNGLVQSKNPYYFPDGIGDNGSDFTVGSVLVRGGMGNFFKGYINSIAVFDRALSDVEMKQKPSRFDFVNKKREEEAAERQRILDEYAENAHKIKKKRKK